MEFSGSEGILGFTDEWSLGGGEGFLGFMDVWNLGVLRCLFLEFTDWLSLRLV